MNQLLTAILDDDRQTAIALLLSDPNLATRSISAARYYDSKIYHWMYVGDTALHLAAAGYRTEMIRLLLKAGADPNAMKNHRQSGPLHYAADGCISSPEWDAKKQVKAIQCLIEAGAKINAQDKNGASPLHRAVRTRCAEAVRFLLQAGSNPTLKNKPGSTPFHLAVQNTGRGGSGTDEAHAAQKQIIKEFLSFDVSVRLNDGKGKTVADCATSEWVREVLTERNV